VAILIVLDASAGVELLLQTPVGREIGARLPGTLPVVPAHFDAEVFSALGRLVRAHELEAERLPPILDNLSYAPFQRYPITPLLAEAWELRHNLTQRDALYVVLARRLGAALWTADARLARAPELGIGLELWDRSGSSRTWGMSSPR
jgi:predicted nucleic acid-binding protein